MKLDRFSKIRRHRIFRDFAWGEALPNFSQFNLIYGWNGTGKTTLSGIFKNLQSAQNLENGEVDFVFDGTTTPGRAIASTALPAVRVFNRDTVARSVFESSSRDFVLDLPAHAFKFLHKGSDLLKHALLFRQELRIQRTHFRQHSVKLCPRVTGKFAFQ